MTRPVLEVCVDDIAGLHAAVEGGADRIELCAALPLGGLTPSAGLMRAARKVPVPVMAMIRPRAGDFIYSTDDIRAMQAEIAAVRDAGLQGVVIGASQPDGRLNGAVLAQLLDAASGMDVTLHRAIDLCPNPVAALGEAMELGLRRVLTSGGAGRAIDGAATLARMVKAAAGACEVMAGSGVDASCAPALLATGAGALHGSCSTPAPNPRALVEMGFVPKNAAMTDAGKIRALKRAMAAWGENGGSGCVFRA